MEVFHRFRTAKIENLVSYFTVCLTICLPLARALLLSFDRSVSLLKTSSDEFIQLDVEIEIYRFKKEFRPNLKLCIIRLNYKVALCPHKTET